MRNQHNSRNIDVSRARRARRPATAAPRRSAYDVQKDMQRPAARAGQGRPAAGQGARRAYDVQRDTAYAGTRRTSSARTQQAGRRRRKKTVSYTHLTLPTIA